MTHLLTVEEIKQELGQSELHKALEASAKKCLEAALRHASHTARQLVRLCSKLKSAMQWMQHLAFHLIHETKCGRACIRRGRAR